MSEKKKEYLIRSFKANSVEVRELDGGKRVLTGLIPFNQRSEWMGFFEYIAPSAFNKTLADGADVRALWNHDDSKLLGRVKNGSLRLVAQEDGLHIECDLPETTYADDVYNLVRSGYNNGMSFGFNVVNDVWEQKEEDGRVCDVRTLLEVRLFEVSFAVTFPAYEGTDSATRSVRSLIDSLKKLDLKNLSEEERTELENTLKEIMPEEEKPVPVEDKEAGDPTSLTESQEAQLEAFMADF